MPRFRATGGSSESPAIPRPPTATPHVQARRKEKVDLAKPFHNILLLSIGPAFSLCLGEFAFRFYAPRLRTHDDFKRFSAAARQQGQSIGEYAEAIDQRDFTGDPEGRNLLGWSRKSNESIAMLLRRSQALDPAAWRLRNTRRWPRTARDLPLPALPQTCWARRQEFERGILGLRNRSDAV